MAWKNKRTAAQNELCSPSVLRNRAEQDDMDDGSGMMVASSPAYHMGTVEAPPWFQMYESRMSTKLTSLSEQIAEVAAMTKDAKYIADMAIEAAAEAHEKVVAVECEIEDMKSGLWTKEDIEYVIQEEFKKMMQSPSTNARYKNDDRDGAQDRLLEVIVGGFEQNTDEAIIKQTINKFLELENRMKNVEEVFTFSDPAKVGAIRFTSESPKIRFYKQIRDAPKEVNGHELWFTNNRTFQERVRDKTLGRIKHELVENQKCDASDVRIFWKIGIVKHKGDKVATVEDDGTFAVNGIATNVENAVRSYMTSWVEERSR